jgi:hypothetical protein
MDAKGGLIVFASGVAGTLLGRAFGCLHRRGHPRLAGALVAAGCLAYLAALYLLRGWIE